MLIRRVIVSFDLIVAWATGTGLAAKGVASPQIALPPGLVTVRTIKAQELLLSAQKLLPKGAFLGRCPMITMRSSAMTGWRRNFCRLTASRLRP